MLSCIVWQACSRDEGDVEKSLMPPSFLQLEFTSLHAGLAHVDANGKVMVSEISSMFSYKMTTASLICVMFFGTSSTVKKQVQHIQLVSLWPWHTHSMHSVHLQIVFSCLTCSLNHSRVSIVLSECQFLSLIVCLHLNLLLWIHSSVSSENLSIILA